MATLRPVLKIEEETLSEYLLNKAKHWAQDGHGAYLEDGITKQQRLYKDLDSDTARIASHFYKQGLRKGDIVIYMTTYEIHQIPLMIGIWRANGIARSLYIEESEETILEKLVESKARWLFCDASQAEHYHNIGKRAPWPVRIVVCGPGLDGFENVQDYFEDDGTACPTLEVNGNDTALILPTSGTTGASKGAEHTHKSALFNIHLWACLPWTYPKPNLKASKGVHVSGSIFNHSFIAAGVKGIVLHKFDKQVVAEMIEKYQPGAVFALSSFLVDLPNPENREKAKSIEHFVLSGNKITEALQKSLLTLPSAKSATVVYGMTEGLLFTHTADPDIPLGSVGKKWPGTELQLRNPEDDTLIINDPHVQGEVCVKTPCLMTGYYKNSKATKETFIGDGWLKTGDIGYVDEKGYLYLVDRAKEIFKYAGNHVSPTEIEEIIVKHPDVVEVCVVPVLQEDCSEAARAFLRLKNPKAFRDSDLSVKADEIKAWADEQLAWYKQLKGGVYIVEELPKGKTGKVTRRLVADMPLPNYAIRSEQ